MVRKYIHRGTGNVVEAVCFYGEMKEVIDFIGKDRKAIFNNGAFAIEADSGCGRLSTCVNIGDYVVKSDIDEICVFTPSVFERVYGKVKTVRKYRHLISEAVVEALRFDGTNVDEVVKFAKDRYTGYGKGVVAIECDGDGCKVVNKALDGDYIVKTEGGQFNIMTESVFKQAYSEVEAKSYDDLKFNPFKKTYMPSALIEATYRIKSLSIKVDKVLIDHLVKMLEQGAKATERVEQLERRIVEERRESNELGHQNIVNLCTRILEGVDANGQNVCGE